MTNTRVLFDATWAEAVEEAKERSPSFETSAYIVTGKAGKEYGGKRNEAWWIDHGPEMLDRWVKWRAETAWDLWEPVAGHPAIEMLLSFSLPNGIPVEGAIDRVFKLPHNDALVIVDIKTGRLKDTAEQLGLYATGLEILGYPRPKWGYFWDAQKGTHGPPITLDRFTPSFFATLFAAAVSGINAGSFLPVAQNNCRNWCGVADYCHTVGGHKAPGVDSLAADLTLTPGGNQ